MRSESQKSVENTATRVHSYAETTMRITFGPHRRLIYHIHNILHRHLVISVVFSLFFIVARRTNAYAFHPNISMKRFASAPNVSGQYKRQAASLKASTSLSSSGVDGDELLGMLSRMTRYFYSMVDPKTKRFYYRCLPDSGRRIHRHCPIRDLGSAWDTATLLAFWNGQSKSIPNYFSTNEWNGTLRPVLSDAVLETIDAYTPQQWLTFEDANGHVCAAIPSTHLLESSNVAHSAFLSLATNGALRLDLSSASLEEVPVDSLIRGILGMQQDSGAFAIHFGSDDIFRGIEFYPGEAMLAMMDTYELSLSMKHVLSTDTQEAILAAMNKAFLFYSNYYRRGNVEEHYTSFFANWQVQSFARLFDLLRAQEESSLSFEVTNYIFELCNAVISSRPWCDLLKGRWNHLSTVEIACGLEALAEGTRVATVQESNNAQVYWQIMEKPVSFLSAVQNQVPVGASAGSGGLGHALKVSEQRLDVTGHAVNALIKLYMVHQDLLVEHAANLAVPPDCDRKRPAARR